MLPQKPLAESNALDALVVITTKSHLSFNHFEYFKLAGYT